jgi:hypothetical protein
VHGLASNLLKAKGSCRPLKLGGMLMLAGCAVSGRVPLTYVCPGTQAGCVRVCLLCA